MIIFAINLDVKKEDKKIDQLKSPLINKNIPKISYPFTMSHEVAHQYGISFENEANFFGLKNTLNSNDKVINYSGKLMALQYLLYDLRLKDNKTGLKLINKLNGGVMKNLQE